MIVIIYSQNIVKRRIMTDTVRYDENERKLIFIEQTLLPNEFKICSCDDIDTLIDAIKRLAIRGAPAIGVGAALGLFAAFDKLNFNGEDDFFAALYKEGERLANARPTAVNLSWAVKKMLACAENNRGRGVDAVKSALKEEALGIYNADIETCKKIGTYGEALIKDGATVLTHCNAGALAAVRYGTALAPIYIAKEKGKRVSVIADETRPLLQGARLTAWELAENGVDVTLICDNMAASLMAKGMIDAVFVGADRVAANGDAANKIGTLSVAVNANRFGIPFYVCAPFSTIDLDCENGDAIKIEQRAEYEVTELYYKQRMTHKNVKVLNPAFDVTPNELITAIITEKGVFKRGERLK